MSARRGEEGKGYHETGGGGKEPELGVEGI